MEDHELIQMEEYLAEEVQMEEDSTDEEEEDDHEREEVEELIPTETTISSSVADDSADDSNMHGGKSVSQENDRNDGGQKELNRGEIDVCPICFEVWTSGGDHRIWYEYLTHCYNLQVFMISLLLVYLARNLQLFNYICKSHLGSTIQ
ncbi:MAG: hypothetical protein Q8874_02595 [Sweet potato little leaf phytoplasma]|nr:hypothetical protein [Sweet potato little leaf phytoplasma]